MNTKFLLTSVKSVNSTNKDYTIDVDLKTSNRNIIHTNIVDKLNSMEVFELERDKCEKYRLIFTIKPYCSNVLFNPFTEIVKYYRKDDGSVSIKIKKDNETTKSREYYIQNTSINNKTIDGGYIYYPGYDIFNNHILRDKSFKIVSNTKNQKSINFNSLTELMYDRKGNIIPIYYRAWENNLEQPLITKLTNKHLYDKEDILPFYDGSAINQRLIEEDGWMGFENVSQIKTRKDGVDINIDKVINNKNGGDFIDMYPDRSLYSFNPKYNELLHRLEYNWHYVLTYPFACDTENNFSKFILDIDGIDVKSSGLRVSHIEKTKNGFGVNVILFRTFSKHGLKNGDSIRLSVAYKNDEIVDTGIEENKYKVVSTEIMVSNIGDISGNNKENYFMVENMETLKLISIIMECGGSEYDANGTYIASGKHNWLYKDDGSGYFDDEKINNKLQTFTFMVNRMYGGIPSEYYFRVFKKIPCLKFKEKLLTSDIVNNLKKFNEYLNNNCKYIINNKNGYQVSELEFTKENSKLAFASSIYSDDVTQLLYTDDIDLEYLTDNLGRPLTEFYLTIIKNNKGHEVWYDNKSWNDDEFDDNSIDINDIEYSHCFGKLSCGLEFNNFSDDIERAKYGDVRMINNLNLFNSKSIYYSGNLNNDDDINKFKFIDKNGFKAFVLKENNINFLYYKKKDETIEDKDNLQEIDGLFYGDFVEYNQYEVNEIVLEECMYRFNTYQREMPWDNGNSMYYKLCGWDITSDDFDLVKNDGDDVQSIFGDLISGDMTDGNFAVFQRNYAENTYELGGKVLQSYQKPEGYYYKPHQKVDIKEFGILHQDSHYDLKIKNAQPIQLNGIYICITTNISNKCVMGDKIYICDADNDVWYYTYIAYVVNNNSFYINPKLRYVKDDSYSRENWVTISQNINNGIYKVRRENNEIPFYAQRVNENQFLWRDIRKSGDKANVLLEEYPYTNNSFYITKNIDFFLKRQDPHGNVGLYSGNIEESFPQDVEGISQDLSNYEYKDETMVTC